MNIERRVRPFEVKAMDGGDGGGICTFEGLGAVYLNLDWKGDVLDPGSLAADLPFMVAEGKVRDEHYVTTGKILDGKSTPQGLFVKGVILDTSAGRDQAALVKGGAITRLSIGFIPLKREWLNSPDEVKSYWQSKGYTPTEDDLVMLGAFGGARLVTRAKVVEVSTTWLPVNDKARITEAKGGPRAGRSFADHSETVLATVGEYLERAEGLAKMRTDSGRSISPEAKSRLATLKGRLETLLSSLETKARADAPTPTADSLYAEYLATSARLDGLID